MPCLKVGGAPPIERLIIDVAIVIALYTAARLALRFYFPPDTCRYSGKPAGESALALGMRAGNGVSESTGYL